MTSAPSDWTAFVKDITQLRQQAVSAYSRRRQDLTPRDAEGTFHLLVQDAVHSLREKVQETNAELNCYSFIAYHIVSGSTGIEYDSAPNKDFEEPHSIKSFLERIIANQESAFQAQAEDRKPRRRSAVHRKKPPEPTT